MSIASLSLYTFSMAIFDMFGMGVSTLSLLFCVNNFYTGNFVEIWLLRRLSTFLGTIVLLLMSIIDFKKFKLMTLLILAGNN